MTLVAIILGLAIGLVVGTVGGGGAVLAVPALVYVIGLDMHAATPVGLAVVAAASASGAIAQLRRGTVCWSSAGWFALAAIGGAALGTAANAALPEAALLLVFALVMLPAQLPELAGSDVPVAFICRSGGRSKAALGLAERAGVDGRNVAGGMIAWQRAGLPIEAGRTKARR